MHKTMSDFITLAKAETKPKERQTFKVAKVDTDKRQVFGWANITADPQGNELVDWQEDMIDPEELEKAVYTYVLKYRSGGEMHANPDVAVMIESCMFTKEKIAAMGLPEGSLPIGWWIGFQVLDDEVWAKVKSGEYSMFSIGGRAIPVPVDDDGNPIEEEEDGDDTE